LPGEQPESLFPDPKAPPPAPGDVATAGIARVVTDVSGIDKEFDYLIPARDEGRVEVGTEVRLPFGPRRVGGWVIGRPDRPQEGITLRPLAKVRGYGPSPDVVDLVAWAAWRWAGRRSAFLRTASAGSAVASLPVPGPVRCPTRPPSTPVAVPRGGGPHLIELAPAGDPTTFVAEVAQQGPTLVVVPSVHRAAVLAARLARAGASVALLPQDWASARAGGAGVVIGSRAAAFGPCPDPAAVVVLDAHDEGLSAEGAPTWSAVGVAVERAGRRGIPLYALTPAPTLELLNLGALLRQERGARLAGWAITEVIDRRDDDPRSGLWSDRLVAALRAPGRVALILNRTGRVRLLACGSCGELTRCEICGAAVASPTPGLLHCDRCGTNRPTVCTRCSSTRVRNLRIGVSRAREELASLAGRKVGEVTAATGELPEAEVLVGTEALLHRLDPRSGVTTVGFVDFDQELLAPRVRASAEALALLALASRVVRGRTGRVMVQTRQPDHPVVRAAVSADPLLALEGQEPIRRSLQLPPFVSVALVRGDAAAAWVGGLRGVDVSGPDPSGAWMVKAADPASLCDALAAHPRPATGGLRVAVDPARV
jgi:primosomal protein N' (replication factor Y)